jgi:GDP-L-fucose synthase
MPIDKILITGGNGYIAKSIYNLLKNKYQITTITRSNFDLTDYNQTCEWFNEREYDVVVHTAVSGGSRLKADDSTVIKNNIAMFENLYANKFQFKKLISFGSGAEIFDPNGYYGASKKIIAERIQDISDFYNLRIFATFDQNELNTRFIKANILRYIKKEPMIIHTDKVMDFFYMKDLISLVEHYTTHNKLTKSINCSYSQKYTLSNIANIINELGDYKVPVIIENKNKLEFYCGESHHMPIQTLGLEWGIYNVYNSLLNGEYIHA